MTQPTTTPPYTLRYPYTTPAGVHLKTVSPRRLKVRDIKNMSRGAKEDFVQMELIGIALMISVVPEDVEEMDAADYQYLKSEFLSVMGLESAKPKEPVAGGGTAGAVVSVPA